LKDLDPQLYSYLQEEVNIEPEIVFLK